MAHPTHGSIVTSGFRTKSRPTHDGTDYRAAVGTPIHAAAAGTVTVILHNDARAGNYVQIQHAGTPRTVTGYAHLSRIDVTKGAKVADDQIIGLAGATGNAQGAHLHFIVKVGANYVNPVQWLKGASTGSSVTPAPAKPSRPSAGGVALREGVANDPERVKELQRVLNAWYPFLTPLAVDGDYGQRTGNRVQYAQQRLHIATDRIAGPITLGALNIKY